MFDLRESITVAPPAADSPATLPSVSPAAAPAASPAAGASAAPAAYPTKRDIEAAKTHAALDAVAARMSAPPPLEHGFKLFEAGAWEEFRKSPVAWFAEHHDSFSGRNLTSALANHVPDFALMLILGIEGVPAAAIESVILKCAYLRPAVSLALLAKHPLRADLQVQFVEEIECGRLSVATDAARIAGFAYVRSGHDDPEVRDQCIATVHDSEPQCLNLRAYIDCALKIVIRHGLAKPCPTNGPYSAAASLRRLFAPLEQRNICIGELAANLIAQAQHLFEDHPAVEYLCRISGLEPGPSPYDVPAAPSATDVAAAVAEVAAAVESPSAASKGTKVPTVETKQAPTVETKQAPTADATKVPAAETTKVPAAETTKAPAEAAPPVLKKRPRSARAAPSMPIDPFVYDVPSDTYGECPGSYLEPCLPPRQRNCVAWSVDDSLANLHRARNLYTPHGFYYETPDADCSDPWVRNY